MFFKAYNIYILMKGKYIQDLGILYVIYKYYNNIGCIYNLLLFIHLLFIIYNNIIDVKADKREFTVYKNVL